jgi:hypothetical protein
VVVTNFSQAREAVISDEYAGTITFYVRIKIRINWNLSNDIFLSLVVAGKEKT